MRQRFCRLAVTAMAFLLLASLPARALDAPGTGPAQWRAKLNRAARVMHKNVYPGVDLIFSGSHVRLNAQLIVQPGASLEAIRLDMTGAQKTQVGAELQAQLPAEKVMLKLLPVQMFQAAQGGKQEFAGSFVQNEDGSVSLAMKEEYNPKQPLIISLVAIFQPLTQTKETATLAKGSTPTISAAPSVTATKNDQVVPDVDSDGKVIPGETIKYTVTVGNTSMDAADVDYDETVDPNTTLTSGTVKTTPLAYNQTVTVLEDTPTLITLTGNDADGGNLTFATTGSPAKGANGGVTQNPPSSASLTFTPNANANDNTSPAGADGFTFKVTDADANIDNATVTINITPVNDAPVFSCGANQTHVNTDGPAITVPSWATGIAAGPATATDEASQVLTFNVTGNTTPAIFSAGPAVNPANGNLTYTLSGATGQSTITFTLSDDGGTANSGVDTSTPCSFSVTVNGAPTAVADNYNTMPNTTISRTASDPDDLLDNDDRGFPAANLITFGGGTLGGSVTDHNAGTTAVVSGHSLTVNADGSFSYSPATGFTGNFTFNYRITNVAGSSDAMVTIAVQAAPMAVADNYFTPVNTTISRSTSDPDDLLDNDNLGSPAATLTSFGGGSLGGAVTDNAAGANVALAGGTLQVNSDGSFSLTTPTVTGSFTFQYRLTNVSGTSDALVTIEVRQAPTAVADNYNMLVNGTLTINTSDPNDLLDNDTRGFPLANVSHFGGGSLGGAVTDNLAGASVALAGGTLQVNSNGSFSLTTPTATGSFTFQYRITNVAGTSDATVTIEVRKAPNAVADNYITQVNTTISRSTSDPDDLLDNDDRGFPLATIINFGGGSLGGAVTDNAAGASVALAGGTLQVNSDGSFSLTTPTVAGSYNFQYRLSNVVNFSDATVTIEVQGPPDAIDDSPIATSVPGNAFHTALNTALNSATDVNTPSVLTNDNLGFPAGALSHFGGGSLGGAVTDNVAGGTATFGTGSLQVLASGEFIFTPDNNFTGLFTFQYRVTNTAGFDDATVTIAVGVRPAAVADARSATGNIRLSTATNLLTNDTGDQLTVTLFDASSAQGGNVTVAANGSFTYNPPPGYEGSDSFNYTVGNGFGNGPAGTVTITVSGMIWFINNTAGAGDGRLTSPFNTLAAFQAVNNGTGNNPAAGDNVFIYTGSGSYTGGVTLLNTQKLIGDGASSTLAAITGITPATGSDALPTFSGTDPTIENSGGNGITLASGNTIRGLTVGNTPAANAGIIGNGFGTLSITDVSINGTGQIFSLNNGIVNATFNQLSTTSTTQTAVVLSNISSGSVTDTDASNSSISGASGVFSITGGAFTNNVALTFNGDVTHAGANPLVIVQNHATATVTFQNGTLTSTGGGVNFTNADGTYNFNGTTTLSTAARITIDGGSSGNFNFNSSTSVTNPSNIALDINGSNATVDYNGTLSSNTAFRLIDIANNTGGSVTIDGALSGTGSSQGIRLQQNSGGTYSFTNASKALNTGANTAVNLVTNSGATINFSNGGLDIDATSGTGFTASGGGTVTVTGSNNTINTTAAKAIDLDAITANITFATISAAGAPTNGLDLTNLASGSSFNVPGATTLAMAAGAGANINLVNNTNSTIRIGTDGTTPAAVNLNSRRTTGVFIDNSSGTIQFGNTTIPNPNSAGGYGIRVEDSSAPVTFASATISNTTQTSATSDVGSDGIPDSDGDGDAIFLKNNTGGFTLNGGTLSNLATDGIDVRNSSNLTVSGVTITQIGVSSANVATVDDAGIYAFNISGTNLVQNSEISRFEGSGAGGAERGINILQTTGNNLTEFRVNNTDFFNLLASGIRGDDGISYRSEGAVNGKLVVENGCTFLNISGLGIEVDPGATSGSSGTFEMDVLNSTFTGQFSTGSLTQGGIESQSQGNMTIDIEIRNSTFTGLSPANANAGVIHFAPQQNNGSFTAVVDGCTILGTVQAPGSGRTGRGAINLRTGDLAGEQLKNLDLTINNCIINDIGDDGIFIDIRGESLTGSGAGTGKVTITNNAIGTTTPVGQDGLEGITFRVRNNLTTAVKTVNLLMDNNQVRNADNSTGDETVDIDAEPAATINATVTNNTFTSVNGLAQDEFRASTENADSFICLDLRNNTATQAGGPAGNGSFTVEEIAGTLNLRHSGNSPAATVGAGVTIIATPCPLP